MRLRGLAPNSVQTYVRYARQFLAHVDRPLAAVKRADIEGFLHTLVDKARSSRTRNVQLGAIRCLLLATVRRDPSAAIPRAKAPRVVPQILSGTGVARLLAATTSPKYRAIHARLRGGPRAGRYRRGRSDTRFGRFRLIVPQGAPIRTSSRRKP